MSSYRVYEGIRHLEEEEGAEIAGTLNERFGSGSWQGADIICYTSIYDFAEYELTEGWYSDLGLSSNIYRGAPNLMEFIDIEALGIALTNTWDVSMFTIIDGLVFQISR